MAAPSVSPPMGPHPWPEGPLEAVIVPVVEIGKPRPSVVLPEHAVIDVTRGRGVPKPERPTANSQLGTRNPEPRTPNPERGTPNAEPNLNTNREARTAKREPLDIITL